MFINITEQLILALFANGITSIFFYKFYKVFFNTNNTDTDNDAVITVNDQQNILDYILNRIKKLELEVNDLHETLEDFENKFVEKYTENKVLRESNFDLQEKHSKLKNDLSNYIVSDYDLIHK